MNAPDPLHEMGRQMMGQGPSPIISMPSECSVNRIIRFEA